jgi:hypothetical protein
MDEQSAYWMDGVGRVSGTKFTIEDVIGFHAVALLEARACV